MQRVALPITIALGASLLVALHLYGSFGLSGDARIVAYSSGIFDMDVDRVVFDWATEERGLRTPVHPLVKLVMAPAVSLARALGGPLANPLNAILVIIALSMAAYALLAGLLTAQLAGGRLLPGLVAALLCAASFSSVLLGAIPETASISGLSTLLPLVYLGRRRGRPFDLREAFCWGLVGVFCIAFTITQIVHWLIALALRGWIAMRDAGLDWGQLRRVVPLRELALLVLTFVVVTGASAQLQSSLYQGTPTFYDDPGIAHERSYMRFDAIAASPLGHGASLLAQVMLYDFAAPRPGFSSRLSFLGEEPWWMISLEETRPSLWASHQWLLLGLLLAAIGAGLYGLRRADVRFVAPLLCVASQLLLHFVYGREYVLYSSNWHGVLVALLVAGAFLVWPGRERLVAAAATLLAGLLLVNNLFVLSWVYGQVEAGLEARLRDLDGELLASPPQGPPPKGRRR